MKGGRKKGKKKKCFIHRMAMVRLLCTSGVCGCLFMRLMYAMRSSSRAFFVSNAF